MKYYFKKSVDWQPFGSFEGSSIQILSNHLCVCCKYTVRCVLQVYREVCVASIQIDVCCKYTDTTIDFRL
jgi:hypothetical protein